MMSKGHTIDQVEWHTSRPDSAETVEQVHERFRAVIDFLQQNGLTTREILAPTAEITDSTRLHTADLTAAGKQVARSCYHKWLEAIDRGSSPRDLSIFERELARVRAVDEAAVAEYLGSLRSLLEELSPDSDWQRVYQNLPNSMHLDGYVRLAVIARLDELHGLGSFAGFRLPADGLPKDPDAAVLSKLRADLFATLLESRLAQDYLLEALPWRIGRALEKADTRSEIEDLQLQRAELRQAGRLMEENRSDYAAYVSSGRKHWPAEMAARSDRIRAILLKVKPPAAVVADAARRFAECALLAERLIAVGKRDEGTGLEALDCRPLPQQAELLARARQSLSAYCELKERLLARYLGYVVLASLSASIGVDPSELGRVGLHALSTAIDSLSSKSEHLTPRWILWWIEKRVGAALFELRGETEEQARAIHRIREAKHRLASGATLEQIAEAAGLEFETLLRHLDATEHRAPKDSARLVGRAITRDLLSEQ